MPGPGSVTQNATSSARRLTDSVTFSASPPYFTAAVREARLACLRDGRVVVLPGSHHLHMEQPQAVAAPVLEFLRA